LLVKKRKKKEDYPNCYFGLRNFKAFKEFVKIELKPLTIVCGNNNCGKSSLIQAILLLSQSISDVEEINKPFFRFGHTFTKEDIKYNTSLTFEGDLCHLRDYENVLNQYGEEKEFEFFIEYDKSKISLIFFNPSGKDALIKEGKDVFIKEIIIEDEEYQLEVRANLDEENCIVDYSCFIKKLSLIEFFRHNQPLFYISRISDDKKLTKFSEFYIIDYEIRNVNILFNGFIPRSIVIDDSRYEQEMKNIFNNISEENKDIKKLYKSFMNYRKNFLKPRIKQTEEEDNKKIFYDFFDYHERLKFEHFLNTIHYIGPLRDEPHRYYQFFDLRNLKIGNKGEYAPQILTLEFSSKIPSFKVLEINDDQITFIDYEEPDLRLEDGLTIWSKTLNLPDIDPYIVENILFKIRVKLPGTDKFVTLQDVGFGISQILPVYLESLRMKTGHTLILEQPEIHLHPSMQSKLADFLLSMTNSGKNFIVETHSEYLINRLCLRIAQDNTNKLKDLINIVFVEPPSIDEKTGFSGSKINDLEINKYGEIINWPIGFFDEHDYNKLLKAAIEKRKREVHERIKNV
jgi:predicted ATPase